jgi:hypothetical protein
MPEIAGRSDTAPAGDAARLEELDARDVVQKRAAGNPTGANQYGSGTVDNVNDSSRPTGNARLAEAAR